MSVIVGNQRGGLGPLGALLPREKYSNIGLSSIEYFCHFARYEILTALLLMFEVFWGVTPYYWVTLDSQNNSIALFIPSQTV
jgi:hypothetical protein